MDPEYLQAVVAYDQYAVLDQEYLQAVAYMTKRLAVCGIEPPEHGRYSVDSPKVYILYIIVRTLTVYIII